MTLFVVIAFSLMTLFGAPLFAIFGGVALYGFHQVGVDTSAVIIQMTQIISGPGFVAIPLFTFSGYLMAESKAPERLIDVSQSLFGWMPGGLALVSLVACAFFTSFTGASGVTILALGGLLFPILKKKGYPENFSLGLVTCCGSLGLLFPPSLPIIIYGVVAQVDIDKLFAAGILPGILLMVMLAGYSMYVGGTKLQKRTKFNAKVALKSIKNSFWDLLPPIIILVGIYGGLTTVAEAAAVCAFYTLFVELVIYRDVKVSTDLLRIIKDTLVLVGAILILFAVALGLMNLVIDQEIPTKLFDLTKQYISSQFMFLLVLNIFLIVVGCLIDSYPAIIVVVPLIAPIAKFYGVDPVHLGIIFLTNLEIGYLTPPFGLNLFLSSFRFKRPVASVFMDTMPFLILQLIALIIITYVPWLSLVLVKP